MSILGERFEFYRINYYILLVYDKDNDVFYKLERKPLIFDYEAYQPTKIGWDIRPRQTGMYTHNVIV